MKGEVFNRFWPLFIFILIMIAPAIIVVVNHCVVTSLKSQSLLYRCICNCHQDLTLGKRSDVDTWKRKKNGLKLKENL